MRLFSQIDTFSAKRELTARMNQEVASYDREYVLNCNPDEVVDHLVGQYSLELPRVEFDQKEIVEEGEAGRGSYITVSFPFEGSRELLTIRPSTCNLDTPDADIRIGEFRVRYAAPPENRAALRCAIDRDIRTIQANLGHAERDWRNFGDELRSKARLALQQRRDKVQADIQFVGQLGIPIRRRSDMPANYPVPAVRKKPPAVRSDRAVSPPDPTLDLAEYDHILEIISNMVKVMERSPKAFAHMEEEHLRDNILVHLNGHYEGQATGETFNFEGKTDILIRAGGGNVFIAECKFWHGKKAFQDTIDQLLRYVTWRDTKTSIILFNRQKNFSSVVSQIPEASREHLNYVRQVDYHSESGFRFLFKNANDADRQIVMTVLAFDVPS